MQAVDFGGLRKPRIQQCQERGKAHPQRPRAQGLIDPGDLAASGVHVCCSGEGAQDWP